MMKRTCIIISIVLVALAARAYARVTVEKITYRGWPDSYRLTAGDYSLVVVPEIGGRIMEYSLQGRNVLWENPAEFGKTYPVSNDWRNYGGYKTWVSPEDLVGWPPDFLLDAGKANVELFQTPKGLPLLKVVGAPSAKMGVYFTKEITLSEDGQVNIVQHMTNIGAKTINNGIWDVTQVQTPCFVTFPTNPKTKFKDALNFRTAEARNSSQYTFKDGLCITAYKGEVGDITSDSPGPWLVWFKDDLAFVKSFGPINWKLEYPDNGSTCEVFTSKPELGYVEMEVLGPVVELAPGHETDLTCRWRLYKLSQPVTDENRVVKAVRGMQGKGWIP